MQTVDIYYILYLLFSFGGEMTEHCNYTPDIFFLSLCLFFGTFFLASFLKKFKFTSFFPNKVCIVDILGIC